MDNDTPRRKRSDRVTIYDVARHAGVAISTVSRVLNDADDVSPETRKRVLKVVDQLQYRPHRTARSLAQKRLATLAVAVPTFTMPIFTELLKGVQSHMRQHQQVDLLLFDLGSSDLHLKLRRFLDRGTVDGLLLGGVPVDRRFSDELTSLGAQVVLIGDADPDFDSFRWDSRGGARRAVEHLLELGHRRIGMIVTGEGMFDSAERQQGYREAIEAAGIAFEERLVKRGRTPKHMGSSEEAGYEALNDLLDEDPSVTAVFTGSDVLAIGAWKAAQDRDRAVPEALSIVGYENVKVSRYIDLTTVDLDMQEIGERATELLVDRMQGRQAEVEVLAVDLTPELVVRRSTAPPPSE